MAGPLNGAFRVLDLSERSPSAAIAGMTLSDLGAEVIRVEPPGGDPLRVLPASRVWLRGQQSVTISPQDVTSGRWQALRASSDVILTTAQPWMAKPAGLLDGCPDNPRQILCTLTALPRAVADVSGPRHGAEHHVYGELVEAMYGIAHSIIRTDEQRPTFLGWPLAAYGAAWMIQLGILGALLERERTGAGQVVTTSLLDGAAILRNMNWAGGEKAGPFTPNMSRLWGPRPARSLVALFECSDGLWIQVHTGARGAFDRLVKAVGRSDLASKDTDNPKALSSPISQAVASELWAYLTTTFKQKPSAHWCDLLAKADVCCMPALKPGEVLWLKQIEDNGMVDIAPDGWRQLGKLVKYSRTPITVSREVPAPGQHNGSLLGATSSRKLVTAGHRTEPEPRPVRAVMDDRRVGPLDGMLVLDFGLFMAGPFANRIFADLGARVIKIEELGGDPMRSGMMSSLMGTMRGKESFPVNLKTDEGRKLVYELVKRADIIHYNTRFGAMDRLGMSYETLSKINPRLVVCHSSGYGNEGDWNLLPTFEPLHSALAGVLTRTGGEGNPPDYYLTHMDFGCGLTSASMCVAALVERELTGKGQFLEVPQVGAGIFAMSDVHGYKGRVSETFALDHEQRGHAPTNALYRTSDGWIAIACYAGIEWESVRRGLGLEASGWPAYADARQERRGHSAIARTLESTLKRLTTAQAERRLSGAGVPCVVPQPMSPEQVLAEPTLRELGTVVVEQHYNLGEMREVGHTVRFSTSNARGLKPVPVLGEHTVGILREIGKSDAEIEALIAAKIVRAVDYGPGAAD